MATQDSDRQMEKVVESISVSEENFRKIVGGLGRQSWDDRSMSW